MPVLLVLCAGVPTAWGQDELGKLLERLADGPSDESILYSLEGQPEDQRTLAALKAKFEGATEKRERQAIASTLLRLGLRSGEYFDFLAGYVKDAIADQSPLFVKHDASGKEIRGEFSNEFLNWCALNDKDPRAVAARQFGVYPEDVHFLARAGDPRARDLLRGGLESQNPLIVGYSVEGLGRLHDVEAIPLIAKAAERLPAGDRLVVAMNLPWYSRPEAFQLMTQIAPDARTREFLTRQVQGLQMAELQNSLRRQGKNPGK
jgi:hypothetical protein